MPNVSLCAQENEVHYHEFEYIVYFDNYASSDVNIIDSDTQEVLYTIDSTHYGPFNMKKNKTYIARLVNGQTTQTQRPSDYQFTYEDIVNDTIMFFDSYLYEYNIGYETLGINKKREVIIGSDDIEDVIADYEALLKIDEYYYLQDALDSLGISVINQKFHDYAVNNNKTNYIEYNVQGQGLKARIKNTQTDEIVNIEEGHCEDNYTNCTDEENSILFAKTLPLSDYPMRTIEQSGNNYKKRLQMDIWVKI